jgi:hypothetical protein
MPLSSETARSAPPHLTPTSPRWWICDKDGHVNVAQWPNPALVVWLVAVVVGWSGMLGSDRSATVAAIGSGALVAWALDELVRGASPVRRIIGAVVLGAQLVRLLG